MVKGDIISRDGFCAFGVEGVQIVAGRGHQLPCLPLGHLRVVRRVTNGPGSGINRFEACSTYTLVSD